MKRSLFILSLLVTLGVSAHPIGKKIVAKLYISHFENVLGTSMELKLRSVSQKNASLAETAALAEIKRVAGLLSGYDSQSEFSRWMQTKNKPVVVSQELFDVLSLYDQWREKTNGALDASAQVIGKLWKQAEKEQALPAAEAITNAVSVVKQKHWVLDAATGTAMHTSDAALLLNSFTKSYIIKRAVEAAKAAADIQSIVLNIGGDMIISGDVTENVLVSDPKADAENDAPVAKIIVHDRAVATSGDYRRGEWIKGQWYSHIVDPRSGIPAGEVISATVIAPDATDAGALATSFNVLTPAESEKIAAGMPGVEYMLIKKDGERIESKGWKEITTARVENTNAIAAETWNKGMELAINLELNLITGERVSRRPFVAIWVEDKDKAVVRNLSLWYNKPKWLKDLHEWYRINIEKYTADNTGFASVTSATRSPGKYVIKWDGKDANGNFAKPGMYTVCIEVAREHGTYQIIKQEIECKRSAKQIVLTPNIEIASASLDYRKKPNSAE